MRFFLYHILQLYYKIEHFLLGLISSKKENSILVVRLDAIGDSIIWLDSAKEYKKYFPDKKIVLLCNKIWENIADKLPYFDEVIPFDNKKFQINIGYRLKVLILLRKRKFEKIYSPTYSRSFFIQDILIHNLKSDIKIGYKGDYANTENTLLGFGEKFVKDAKGLEKKANRWYTKLVDNNPDSLMELSRNADFTREIFDKSFRSSLPVIPFPVSDSFNLKKKDYIVLFLGASTPRKTWNINNHKELISKLNEGKIVLCGGKGEEYLGDRLVEISDNKGIINLIGKTSLIELISIIKNATYIITNDTSASHITVAVQTPSVCLLGGSHYGRFQPYQIENITGDDKKYIPKVVYNHMECFNCNNKCIYIKDKNTTWPCIESITVEQVYEKILEIENEMLITE